MRRMPFSFCPQCGGKLQPGFRFCPECGEKLPCPADEPGPVSSVASSLHSLPPKTEASTSIFKTSPAPSAEPEPKDVKVTPRPALRKCRKSLRLGKDAELNISDALPAEAPSTHTKDGGVGLRVSSQKQHAVVFTLNPEAETQSSPPPAKKSPRPVRGKSKLSSPAVKQAEEGKRRSDRRSGAGEGAAVDGSPVAPSSLVSSPISPSPSKGKTKAKKAKLAPTVKPLQEGEEVTDNTGKKWKLLKQLSQSDAEFIYEVSPLVPKGSNHILKLGAKDGKIFKEQNFLQRAAKPATVEKWIKQNKTDFLGIPSCVGFGFHADSYRFLIFPSMGRSLQSVMEEENQLLSEKDVLQLACKILDVLQFVHSNEYVHADINAENVYITPGQESQVYLVGYGHAFRYCPAGKHVEYREASRTPHEGAVEFISLDAHKGAAPSRRSDLQSLGYCLLHWHTGTLPWSGVAQPEQVAAQKQRYLSDVPALLDHCFGKKRISSAFQTYLTSVMVLQHSEQPDYSALKAALGAAVQ